LLTHSINFHYIFGVLAPSLNPQYTLSTTHAPPRSSSTRRTSGSAGVGACRILSFVFHLCPRFPFFWERGGCLDCASMMLDVGAQFFPAAPRFSCSAAFFDPAPSSFLQRPCVDWRLASAWNADAGGAGRQSLTCQVAHWLRSWACGVADSRRAVPMRVPLTFWARFVPRVSPDPNLMRLPAKKTASLALFSRALNRVPQCGREASKCLRFTGLEHVYARLPVNRHRYRYRRPFLRLRR
jgi:hypothetical protein